MRLLGYALSLGLGIGWSSTGACEVAYSKAFGEWKVLYSANDENIGKCVLGTLAGPNTFFAILGTDSTSLDLVLENKNWRIPEGTTGIIEFRFDGGSLLTARFKRFSEITMSFDTEPGGKNVSRFFDLFAAANVFDIKLPDASRYTISLAGSAKAKAEFTKCLVEWAGRTKTASLQPWSNTGSPPTSQTATRPPTPPRTDSASGVSTSGSGIVVDSRGNILTNEHVVRGCTTLTTKLAGDEERRGRIVATSAADDLAVVRAETPYPQFALLSSRPTRLGEPVFVYGFPLAPALASSGNFTLGNVTALAGLRDDYREIQISVPIQPGNSGGPVISQEGGLIGVVSSKLNALRTAKITGDVPQNVNFAVKSSIALAFLESNAVTMRPTETNKTMTPVEAAEYLKKITVQIRCRA